MGSAEPSVADSINAIMMNLKKNPFLLFTFFAISALLASCTKRTTATTSPYAGEKILVFSKTAGFRHDSIEKGAAALKKLGEENEFYVVATENADYFNPDSLAQFGAIVFLNTTGDIFDERQQDAFKKYINNGGGFLGIHAATDTEYDWPWYGKLVGAYFLDHPKQQDAVVKKTSHQHSTTQHLPESWKRWDEWYNFKDINSAVNVLLTLDESSYEGGKNGDNHPIAWYHEYDGGRAYYTAMGHTKESYDDPAFQQHLLEAVKYVLGH